MDPIAFTIPIPETTLGPLHLGPLDIRWYGLMMALSMLVGAWIASLLLKRIGRNGELVWDALFFIIIASISGARLVYCLTNLSEFIGPESKWWGWFAVWQGGLSFHGGVLGGILATVWFFRNKIPFLEVADAMAPGVSLGIILVRIGNYMNGDILGYKWDGPWAMNFPHDQLHYADPAAIITRHPTEIYGMVVGVICLLATLAIWNETYISHTKRVGATFFAFILTYSLARSVFEDPFRDVPLPWQIVDPATAGFGLFTSSHLLSFVLIAIALLGFMALKTWDEHNDDLNNSGSPMARNPKKGKRAAEAS
jgi:phosphatidylglycerol:prolipoprotein diacylglycerol transferase